MLFETEKQSVRFIQTHTLNSMMTQATKQNKKKKEKERKRKNRSMNRLSKRDHQLIDHRSDW